MKNQTKHPLYSRWLGMKQRCYDPDDSRYRHYGARGTPLTALTTTDPRVEGGEVTPFLKYHVTSMDTPPRVIMVRAATHDELAQAINEARVIPLYISELGPTIPLATSRVMTWPERKSGRARQWVELEGAQ